MCVAVNCQMELPSGTTPLFAVFFDLPLTFTENYQPGGINHQMRNFSPGGRFETDTDRFCSFADAAVIRTAKRNAHQGKNGNNEALRGPKGKPEYTLYHQNSGYGPPADKSFVVSASIGDSELRLCHGNACVESFFHSMIVQHFFMLSLYMHDVFWLLFCC